MHFMYDFRCTKYDCQIRALCAGRRRKRLRTTEAEAPSGAHVRCTTVADGVCLCTMLDVRGTIAIIARFARGDIRSKSDVIPNARASLFLQEVSLSIEQRAGNSLPSLSSGMSAQRSSIIADTQTKRRRTFLRLGHAA